MDGRPAPHLDEDARVLRKAGRRQRGEVRALLDDLRGAPGVEVALDDARDELHVRSDGREVAAPSEAERLVERALEDVVALLDDAVLVRFAGLATW